MKKTLFHVKNTYKANLHCHTTVSDGHWSPQQVKDMYKADGYSIVAFSDHNKLVNQSELNDENFLAIVALEVDVSENNPYKLPPKNKCYHLNLFSIDPNRTETPPIMRGMDYNDIAAINKYIKARVDEGFLVSYNHPYWSLQTYDEYSKLKGCFAVEIYNHGCEVTNGYYGYNPQVYDEMLRASGKEANLFCLSTDDNHNDSVYHTVSDSFGGWVMIDSPSLNYGVVMNALKNGNFYSSQGPEIYEIFIEGDKLHIKCSEVDIVVVYTDGRNCHLKQGDSFTEAVFTLSGNEKYIRVMCRDKNHKDANSNAYWM